MMKESTLNPTATPMPTLAPIGRSKPESEGGGVGVLAGLVDVLDELDVGTPVTTSPDVGGEVGVSDEEGPDRIFPFPSRV